MKKNLSLIIVLILVIILAVVYFIKPKHTSVNQEVTAPVSQTTNQPTTNTTIANPASANCVAKGGQVQIQTKVDGSQYGLCFFDDNRACEEWAMMRGDCPVGGVKTTGFDTVEQKFCAWSGGQTIAEPNAVCTFKDGSKCDDVEFYDGECSVGENKKK